MTLSMKMKVKVTGGPEIAAALRGVKAGVANRVLKAAVAKQARKATKVAKSKLKGKRSGQLAKSIGYIYRTYRKKLIWVYVIGPRTKLFRLTLDKLPEPAQRRMIRYLGKQRRRKLTTRQTRVLLRRVVDPAKYAHLVEGGRKAVRPKNKRVLSDRSMVFGRSARAVAERPFMRPAAASIANSVNEVLVDVKEGIMREAAKYAKKGKSIYGG